MTNNVLSEDNTIPASPSAPAPSTSSILSDNVKEIASEASVDVMSPPTKNTPLEKGNTQHHVCIPHTLPSKSVCSVSDLSPASTPTTTRPSTPTTHTRPSSTRRSVGLSSEENRSDRKSDSTVDGTSGSHIKRSKRFRVYVRNSLGTVHEVKVRETDSVRRVKEKISMATDMLPQLIHLLFNGTELNDERATMGQIGVVEGNTLTVMPKLQSGQMEMVEGMPFNEESLYEKIMSQLSDKQMEELSSGTLNKPLSFVTTIGGKRVLVRLKPAQEANGSTSGPAVGTSSSTPHPDLEPWTRGATTSTGVRRDAQWRKEKQVEHQNMRSKMDIVRDRLREAKANSALAPNEKVDSEVVGKSENVKAHEEKVNVTASANGCSGSKVATAEPVVVKKNRCGSCNAKLGPITFPCRCTGVYCSTHRHDHQCSFDYKK
eukprot:comp19152_c0_seq1/m.21829 comp19152_c0_seq1/g.21829  ORF comp19152_c0_seq1/g.21829 comp19152_c0_seq1/m.21829 type:complete len:431 (-) comp19152_c0_seq1:295-1587(-)